MYVTDSRLYLSNVCFTPSTGQEETNVAVFTWEAFGVHDLVLHIFLSAACKENMTKKIRSHHEDRGSLSCLFRCGSTLTVSQLLHGVLVQRLLQSSFVQRADAVGVVVRVVVTEARAGEGTWRRRVQQRRLVVQSCASSAHHVTI